MADWIGFALVMLLIAAYIAWMLRYGKRLDPITGHLYRPSRKPLVWWVGRRQE